jgi:hypothetical protein
MQYQKMITAVREMSWESLAQPLQSAKNPDWGVVKSQIDALETVESGSVFLTAANGSTLSIGGDRGRGYLVFVTDARGHRYLQSPHSQRTGTVNLVIGFQPADYPRRIVVDLNTALRVAREYFDIGRIEDSEDWTFDGRTVEA